MNKSISLALVTLASVAALLLGACSSKDNKSSSSSSGDAGTYATTPQPCNMNGYYNTNPYGNYSYPQQNNTTTCNTYPNGVPGNVSPNGWYYGAWTFPYQWQPNTGYCGCPLGYRSVYTGYGIACAPNAYFSNWYVVTWNMGYNYGYAQNGQNLNIPNNQYVAPSSSCTSQTAQGCDTRLQNCAGNQYCQAAGGGSVMGLCVMR